MWPFWQLRIVEEYVDRNRGSVEFGANMVKEAEPHARLGQYISLFIVSTIALYMGSSSFSREKRKNLEVIYWNRGDRAIMHSFGFRNTAYKNDGRIPVRFIQVSIYIRNCCVAPSPLSPLFWSCYSCNISAFLTKQSQRRPVRNSFRTTIWIVPCHCDIISRLSHLFLEKVVSIHHRYSAIRLITWPPLGQRHC